MIHDSRFRNERGFIGILVLILIALVALKYFFGFSLFAWARTDQGRGALIYLKDIMIWLKEAVVAAWAYIH